MPYIAVTATQLRALLQLPERPYAEAFSYDNSPYYDLGRREIVQILTLKGTKSAVPKSFTEDTDYQVTAGTIDWTLAPSNVPDFGTQFNVEYTYSRLSSDAADSALMFANALTPQELPSTYAYGTTNANGVSLDTLASLISLLYASYRACESLASGEVDTSEKYRRGSIQIDDTKKSSDWLALAAEYRAKSRQMLTLVRGPLSAFQISSADINSLIFSNQMSTGDLGRWRGIMFGADLV